jgi:hypothetical protein
MVLNILDQGILLHRKSVYIFEAGYIPHIAAVNILGAGHSIHIAQQYKIHEAGYTSYSTTQE